MIGRSWQPLAISPSICSVNQVGKAGLQHVACTHTADWTNSTPPLDSREPILSDEAADYVLNDGGHQLPVYRHDERCFIAYLLVPNTQTDCSFMPHDDEWDVDLFEQIPVIPCTTVLVRITLPALDHHGQILSRSNHPAEEVSSDCWGLSIGLLASAHSRDHLSVVARNGLGSTSACVWQCILPVFDRVSNQSRMFNAARCSCTKGIRVL